jgi:hypothetical protein
VWGYLWASICLLSWLIQPCVHPSSCSVILLSIAIVKLKHSLCVLFRRGLVFYNVIKVLHAIPWRWTDVLTEMCENDEIQQLQTGAVLQAVTYERK